MNKALLSDKQARSDNAKPDKKTGNTVEKLSYEKFLSGKLEKMRVSVVGTSKSLFHHTVKIIA